MSENTVTTPMATEAAIAFLKEASRYFSKVGHNGEDAGFWAAQQNSINCLKIVALIEEMSAQRMTGTPSKDRAEGYLEHREEARHAIARSTAIFKTMKDYDRLVDIMATDLSNAHAHGFAEGMKRAAEIARGVGNYGDYKREELTIHYGQPRFDMMHDIVAAILSEAEGR